MRSPTHRAAAATAAAFLLTSAANVCEANASATPQTKAAQPFLASATPPELSQEVIQQIVTKVKPSLVRIHVVEAVPEEGREAKQESFGSGIIVSADGYVVTNHHVAGNARWLSCTLANKEEVDAKLIGTDPLSDIALIKLSPSKSGPYPFVSWGDSSKLQVGNPVLAMGSPLAFSQSVTAGIISNTELILPSGFGGMTLDGEDVGSIVRWIGHDAQILPGNSGGPLINLTGEIIGINEIKVGLSGAIPGNLARIVVQQLMTQGKVTRSYTGIDVQPRLRGDTTGPEGGVLVGGILPGSPAAKAALQPGDLLLSVNDVPLAARYPEQVPLVNLELSRLPVGKPVTLKVMRKGAPMNIKLTPSLRDPAQVRSVEVKGWGLTTTDITPVMALEQRLPTTEGAIITSTLTGGPAADAQPALQEGDVILSVNGKKITNTKSLLEMTPRLTKNEDSESPVVVEVRREGERLVTVVNVFKQSGEDTSIEVSKAWLPVRVQVLTPALTKALNLPASTKGVRVTQIFTEADPAVTSKLKVGDVITKLDGLEIEATQPEETDVFYGMIRQYKIGTPAKIALFRDGKPMNATVTLPRAPKQERELSRHSDDNFGLTVRSVSYQDRAAKTALPGENGAVVVGTSRGGWASLAGLKAGDIIRAIGGVKVTDGEGASKMLKGLEQQRPRFVTFFVSRGVHTMYLEVQTDWSLPAPTTKPTATAATPAGAKQ